MKILVLGSDGQIGTSLVEYLISKNHEVVKFDICSNQNNDLRIKDILDNILPEVDFVFFLAFDVGGTTYLMKHQNSYDFIDNNIKLMNHTFDSLKKHGTKFIFASSQMSNMSFSAYGVLKRIGEFYTDAINGMVVKFWNIYGYEADLEKAHVITDFILMAKNNGVINMKTNGNEERQLLYSDDCSECLSILMEKYDIIDKTKKIDISNFKWNTVSDVAHIISKYYNNCPIIKSESVDNVQQGNKNEPNDYILNFWTPKTSLEVGIIEIIKKYS